jgi:hypothetical protein
MKLDNPVGPIGESLLPERMGSEEVIPDTSNSGDISREIWRALFTD